MGDRRRLGVPAGRERGVHSPFLHLPDLLQDKRRDAKGKRNHGRRCDVRRDEEGHSQSHANCLRTHSGLFVLELGHLSAGGRRLCQ